MRHHVNLFDLVGNEIWQRSSYDASGDMDLHGYYSGKDWEMETKHDVMRRSQLAQIHIAKAQLGLDEDTYRAVLKDVAGVDSASDLSAKGRRDVLKRFESKGWHRKRRPAQPKTSATNPVMGKIGALLADMKLPWRYAVGIAQQMGFQCQRLEWLDNRQLKAVMVALINLQNKNV